MHPLISVIIPSYKPKEYLWECLNSLDTQTIDSEKFEILIILNGCKEPWYSEIQTFIQKNLKQITINLIQIDTPGVSNARNVGINNAKGDYITFIDDDDFISDDYLEELLKKCPKNGISLSNTLAFQDIKPYVFEDYYIQECYLRNEKNHNHNLINCRAYLNGPCMKLIPKEIIGNIRFDTSLKNGEDSIFMFEISPKIKKINFTALTAIYYRRFRKSSAISNLNNKKYLFKSIFQYLERLSRIYFFNPFKYNFIFSVTRFLAPLKVLVSNLFK